MWFCIIYGFGPHRPEMCAIDILFIDNDIEEKYAIKHCYKLIYHNLNIKGIDLYREKTIVEAACIRAKMKPTASFRAKPGASALVLANLTHSRLFLHSMIYEQSKAYGHEPLALNNVQKLFAVYDNALNKYPYHYTLLDSLLCRLVAYIALFRENTLVMARMLDNIDKDIEKAMYDMIEWSWSIGASTQFPGSKLSSHVRNDIMNVFELYLTERIRVWHR